MWNCYRNAIKESSSSLQQDPAERHANRDAQRNAKIHNANAQRSVLLGRNIGHVTKNAHQHGEPTAFLFRTAIKFNTNISRTSTFCNYLIAIPVMPGNSVSVTPATSIGARSKYVHKMSPIDVTSSPKIGINMHGFRRPWLRIVV